MPKPKKNYASDLDTQTIDGKPFRIERKSGQDKFRLIVHGLPNQIHLPAGREITYDLVQEAYNKYQVTHGEAAEPTARPETELSKTLAEGRQYAARDEPMPPPEGRLTYTRDEVGSRFATNRSLDTERKVTAGNKAKREKATAREQETRIENMLMRRLTDEALDAEQGQIANFLKSATADIMARIGRRTGDAEFDEDADVVAILVARFVEEELSEELERHDITLVQPTISTKSDPMAHPGVQDALHQRDLQIRRLSSKLKEIRKQMPGARKITDFFSGSLKGSAPPPPEEYPKATRSRHLTELSDRIIDITKYNEDRQRWLSKQLYLRFGFETAKERGEAARSDRLREVGARHRRALPNGMSCRLLSRKGSSNYAACSRCARAARGAISIGIHAALMIFFEPAGGSPSRQSS